MNRVCTCLVAAIFSAGFLACTSPRSEMEEDETPTGESTFLAGHAVFGHEVRSIRPCGAEQPVWAVDSTQLIWEKHQELAPGMDPYEEVFVVVRGKEGDRPSDGFGAEYDAAFYVEQVVYAASEGFGCNLDLTGFAFRLSGNEPFWNLEITSGLAELNSMDGPQRSWDNPRLEVAGSAVSYDAIDTEHGELSVSITEEPCRDSMSGAYHGYSASVTVAGETLVGCAILGEGR